MRHRDLTAAAALALILGAPIAAQQWTMPDSTPDSGEASPQENPFSPPRREPGGNMEDTLDGIMQDMFSRLQPHLEGLSNELAGTVDEFRPALNQLAGVMDDIGNYETPERLPNGDILIRRRADAPPPPPLEELQRLLPRGDEGGRTEPRDPPPPALRDLLDGPQTEL